MTSNEILAQTIEEGYIHPNFQNKVIFSYNVYIHPNKKKESRDFPNGWSKLTESLVSTTHNSRAVLTGPMNNITCVDVDDMELWDYIEPIMGETYMDESSSNKRHIYYKYNKNIKTNLLGCLDILNEKRNARLGKPLNDYPLINMPIEMEEFLINLSGNNNNSDIEFMEFIDLLPGDCVKSKKNWLAFGQSLKFFGQSFEVWDEISKKDEKGYKKNKDGEMMTHWAGFHSLETWQTMADQLVKKANKNLEDQEIQNEFFDFVGNLFLTNKVGVNTVHKIHWDYPIITTFKAQGMINSFRNIELSEEAKEWAVFNFGMVCDLPEYKMLNSFDPEDDFYWRDFMGLLTKKERSYNDQEFAWIVVKHLPKVFARVNENIITKVSRTELFNFCKWKDLEDFVIKDYSKKGFTLFKTKLSIQLNWLTHKSFEKFDSTFDFSYSNPKQFYMSKPFAAKHLLEKPKEYSEGFHALMWFLENVICWDDKASEEQNKEQFDWFIKWLAFMWKYPYIKTGKVLLLYSAQGSGKGTVCDFLIDFVFGSDNSCENLQWGDLMGHKTWNLLGKKFATVNELPDSKATFMPNQEKFKSWVTDKKMFINKMHADLVGVTNNLEFLLMTNNKNTLSIENKDRRYAMFTVSEKHLDDRKYFAKLRKQIMNQEVGNEFVSYLWTKIQSEDEWFMIDIPSTSLKERAKLMSRHPTEEFGEALMEGDIEQIQYEVRKIKDIEYKVFDKDALYILYAEWMRTNGYKPSNARCFTAVMSDKFGFETRRIRYEDERETCLICPNT